MTRAWSVECPLNDQGLVRPSVAAGETVFMSDSGGEVRLRPSRLGAVALAIPAAPDWRVSPDLHVLPGTTRWPSRPEENPDAVSDRGAAVRGGGGGCPQGTTSAKEET